MIGINFDPSQQAKDVLTNNRKTTQFAERLSGRFFVSGVSGSLQKHYKMKYGIDLKASEKPLKYTYQPLIEQNRREELRRDAMKLMEMEEKLNQIQRMKELKRQRDRARRKRKMEYTAAATIQRMFRIYRREKNTAAITVLTSFLRMLAARQAVSVASWASSVIREFAQKYSLIWREKHYLKKAARKAAIENWNLVQEVASIWTQARRATTDEFVFYCIKTGMAQAVYTISTKRKKKRNKRFRLSRSKSMSSMDKEQFQQFFLTEFDMADSSKKNRDDGDDDSDSGSDDDSDDDGFNCSPGKRKNEKLNHSPSRRRVKGAEGNMKRQKTLNLLTKDEEKKRRIAALHEEKMKKIEVEEERRRVAIEKKKATSEQRKEAKRLEAEKAKKIQEDEKIEFLKKIEENQRNQAKLIAKLRKEKEYLQQQKQIEDKRQETERRQMHAEDKYYLKKVNRIMSAKRPKGDTTTNKDPTTQSRSKTQSKAEQKPVSEGIAVDPITRFEMQQASKKPYVPRQQVSEEAAERLRAKKKQEEELKTQLKLLIEEKRSKYTSDEAVKRSRAAAQRRLALKKQRTSQVQKAIEDAENEKKQKLQQIADEAQARLQKALEAKNRKQHIRKKRLYHVMKAREMDQRNEEDEGDNEPNMGDTGDKSPSPSFNEGSSHGSPEDNTNLPAENYPSKTTTANTSVLKAISSAPEEFKELMEDFQAEDFLQQEGLQSLVFQSSDKTPGQIHRTNSMQDIQPREIQNEVEEVVASGNSGSIPIQSVPGKVAEVKKKEKPDPGKPGVPAVKKKAKPISIPKQLQDTPYFASYHRQALLDQPTAAAISSTKSGNQQAASKSKSSVEIAPAAGGFKEGVEKSADLFKVGMSKDNRESIMTDDHQDPQKSKVGKVGSLMEMINKARKKLQESIDQDPPVPTNTITEPALKVCSSKVRRKSSDSLKASESEPVLSQTKDALDLLASHQQGNEEMKVESSAAANDFSNMKPPPMFSMRAAPTIPLPPLGNDSLNILLKKELNGGTPVQTQVTTSTKVVKKSKSKKKGSVEEKAEKGNSEKETGKPLAVSKSVQSMKKSKKSRYEEAERGLSNTGGGYVPKAKLSSGFSKKSENKTIDVEERVKFVPESEYEKRLVADYEKLRGQFNLKLTAAHEEASLYQGEEEDEEEEIVNNISKQDSNNNNSENERKIKQYQETILSEERKSKSEKEKKQPLENQPSPDTMLRMSAKELLAMWTLEDQEAAADPEKGESEQNGSPLSHDTGLEGKFPQGLNGAARDEEVTHFEQRMSQEGVGHSGYSTFEADADDDDDEEDEHYSQYRNFMKNTVNKQGDEEEGDDNDGSEGSEGEGEGSEGEEEELYGDDFTSSVHSASLVLQEPLEAETGVGITGDGGKSGKFDKELFKALWQQSMEGKEDNQGLDVQGLLSAATDEDFDKECNFLLEKMSSKMT